MLAQVPGVMLRTGHTNAEHWVHLHAPGPKQPLRQSSTSGGGWEEVVVKDGKVA